MQPLTQIDQDVYATGQLADEDFAALAAQGVRTIVNNRPDGEEPGQLTAARGAELAAANGMQYHYIPVGKGGPTEDAVAAYAKMAADAPRPMVAHCRSGQRSTTIHQLAKMFARGAR